MPDLIALVGVIVFGIAYGITGYVTKAPAGEPLLWRKLIRTTLIYAAAAVLVFYGGESVTQTAVETEVSAGVATFFGLAFDMIWSKLRNAGYIPTWLTGSINP